MFSLCLCLKGICSSLQFEPRASFGGMCCQIWSDQAFFLNAILMADMILTHLNLPASICSGLKKIRDPPLQKMLLANY